MNQTWENGKNMKGKGPDLGMFNPNLGANIFLWVLPLLDVRKISQAVIVCNFKGRVCSKLKKLAKKLISGLIKARWAQIAVAIFFCAKIWLDQSLHIMISYHHVQYQKKLQIQSWELLVTDGRTDRQTDESDFIGYSRTNFEHPITNK